MADFGSPEQQLFELAHAAHYASFDNAYFTRQVIAGELQDGTWFAEPDHMHVVYTKAGEQDPVVRRADFPNQNHPDPDHASISRERAIAGTIARSPIFPHRYVELFTDAFVLARDEFMEGREGIHLREGDIQILGIFAITRIETEVLQGGLIVLAAPKPFLDTLGDELQVGSEDSVEVMEVLEQGVDIPDDFIEAVWREQQEAGKIMPAFETFKHSFVEALKNTYGPHDADSRAAMRRIEAATMMANFLFLPDEDTHPAIKTNLLGVE